MITNPICFRCLEQEVTYWLMQRNPELVHKVRQDDALFSSYRHKGTRCIMCGNNMNTCSHCYCSEIRNILKPYPELEQEFMQFFNFELQSG
jgi:hypothetical protein